MGIQKISQPEFINEVPKEKHAWLTTVGETVVGYLKEHKSDVVSAFACISGNQMAADMMDVAGMACHEHAFCTQEVLMLSGVGATLRLMEDFYHVYPITNDDVIVDAIPGSGPPDVISAVHREHRQRLGVDTLLIEPLVNVCAKSSSLGGRYEPSIPYRPEEDSIFKPPPRETIPSRRKKAVLQVMSEHPPDLSHLAKTNPYKK